MNSAPIPAEPESPPEEVDPQMQVNPEGEDFELHKFRVYLRMRGLLLFDCSLKQFFCVLEPTPTVNGVPLNIPAGPPPGEVDSGMLTNPQGKTLCISNISTVFTRY